MTEPNSIDLELPEHVEARHEAILDAATVELKRQGHWPIGFAAIAERTGASRSVIYAHFPTQFALANALLRRRLVEIETQVMTLITADDAPCEQLLKAGDAYQRLVASQGPVVSTLVSDRYLHGELDEALLRGLHKILLRLARILRSSTSAPLPRPVATTLLLICIPEELGTLAFTRKLDPDLAADLSARYLRGGIAELSR